MRLCVEDATTKERTLSERVTKKIFSKREKSKEHHSESPHCNRHHLPRHPHPSIPQHPISPLSSHQSLIIPTSPNIPSSSPSPFPTTLPLSQLLDSFTPPPYPRVPTGTHKIFQKEIMAELIRQALPIKLFSIYI